MPDDVRLLETRSHIVAVEGERITGTIGVLVQPGRVGLVFPVELDGAHPTTVGLLIEAAIARLQRENAAFAQLTLPPDHAGLAHPFEQRGFRHITAAILLERQVPPRHSPPESSRLKAVRCDPQADAQYLEPLIAAINRNSLDCPELDALRTAGDLLVAHRGASEAGRARWWRYEEDGNDVGIVLATTAEDADAWEILFFGVLPEHRGRGLGRQLLLHLDDVAGGETPRIRAGVDSRNPFAIRTYSTCSYLETGRVEVWIHPLATAG